MIEQATNRNNTFEFVVIDFRRQKFSICGSEIVEDDVVARALKEISEKFMKKKNKQFGMYKSVTDEHTPFDAMKITHKVKRLYIDKYALKCELEFLDTEEGNKILMLLENGYEIEPYFDPYNQRLNITGADNLIPFDSNLKDLMRHVLGNYESVRAVEDFERQYKHDHIDQLWMMSNNGVQTLNYRNMFS